MTDLHYFLALLTVGAGLYAVFTLRHAARRLHYRDRPIFWRKVVPLVAALVVMVGLLVIAFTGTPFPGLLWVAAGLAVLEAGAAWYIDLEPQKIVRGR